jgi:hypothetical protein
MARTRVASAGVSRARHAAALDHKVWHHYLWHRTLAVRSAPVWLAVRSAPPHVRRTPGISCEAVPASMPLAGAGMRRHVHSGNHAAESFVSFIPLFDGTALEPVLDLQACHLAKVPRVVRYDDETERESLRSNQGVEHADRLSAFRKIGSDLRKAFG